MERAKSDDSITESVAANPVYRRKDPDLPLRHIYFYYLEKADDGSESLRVYLVDQGSDKVVDAETVRQLVADADSDVIKPDDTQILNVPWTTKSYLVFVLKSRTHKLAEGNAVSFVRTRPPEINNTFHDGVDVTISSEMSGVFCINHRLDKNGNQIRKSEHFNVDFGVVPPLMRFHAESGTNVGP